MQAEVGWIYHHINLGVFPLGVMLSALACVTQ